MALILTVLAILASLLAIFFGGLYLYFSKQYNYWAKKNVPHTKPKFPFGDLTFGKNISEVFLKIYKAAEGKPYIGFWLMHKPHLLINDLDLIRSVLVQDFHAFPDHGNYYNEKDDPLAGHLFSMNGQKWRNLRAKLSPTFTSGKMKGMFPIFENISNNMVKLVKTTADVQGSLEMKDLIARYGTDIIASCAYGIETNSLENPNSIFRTMGQRLFMPSLQTILRTTTTFFLPDIARFFKVVQTDKQLTKFFMSVFKETIEYREKNNVERNDVVQLLMQLKNKGVIDDIDDKSQTGDIFTMDLAAANAFVFFIGGFETTSGVMQFVMYELAKNQSIQDKLRAEIRKELEESHGNMTYEGLFKLKYLGMVLDETLRKYPAAPLLFREAAKDYVLPGTDVLVEKGTVIYVSSVGLHHDPRYYPNPDLFDPERFSEEAKASRNNYAYLPFGEGPRFCIGQRFAQLQMRAALFTLISNFKFDVCEKTPEKIILDPKSFLVSPLGGMHLKVTNL